MGHQSWTTQQDVPGVSASSPHRGHRAASQSVLRHCWQLRDGLRPTSCRNWAEPLNRPVRIWCTSTADALSMLAIGGGNLSPISSLYQPVAARVLPGWSGLSLATRSLAWRVAAR